MKHGALFLLMLSLSLQAGTDSPTRAQRYATYKAYSILPGSLKMLVKMHSKSLFRGLEYGLRAPSSEIDEARIMREARAIAQMIDNRRSFKDVVTQMGVVAGLTAVYTNPSDRLDPRVSEGFHHYLNRKLNRFRFVFKGYPERGPAWRATQNELARIFALKSLYAGLLRDKYAGVGFDIHHAFDERSAVFGVCSNYFSNLAQITAFLWYDAWSAANGDLSRTPFVGNNVPEKRTSP